MINQIMTTLKLILFSHIITVTLIMLISLAPTSHCEFSMSIVRHNLKRAPEMSTIFELYWFL